MEYTAKLRRSRFSLLEMVLALSIIGIAMVVAIGLIPVGTNTIRDAMGRSYSAHSGDHLLNALSAQIKSDWTALNSISETGYSANISSGETFSLSSWTSVGAAFPNLYHKLFGGVRVYRLVNTSGDVREYDALVRVWKSTSTAWTYSGGWAAQIDSTYTDRAQLNVEFSWPATIPYSSRKKAQYSTEVSRQ